MSIMRLILRDTFTKKFDIAYVLKNDTDHVELIRIVTEEIGLQVCIVSPYRQRNRGIPVPAPSLKRIGTSKLYIDNADLIACQITDPIISPIRKPVSWN
ncbi:MAG: hypothetical protein JSC189_000922 [Candidatus Tokpelaia sp. JSC189]|nr:MAG: hypothetical protein JSC189_000922 [Candidatus Tokpelaia sp. JSC189]